MPTTTQKTIGTSADYSSVQAWEDACPANLVTNDEIWQGRVKNETVSGQTIVAGITTDATRYIELTTDTGASFLDNVNVRTNALRANASNGALLTHNLAYENVLDLTTTANLNIRINKLQLTIASGSNRPVINTIGSTPALILDRCILETVGSGATVARDGDNGKISNCLIVHRNATPAVVLTLSGAAGVYNCTIVAANGTATNLLSGASTGPPIQNCNLFNGTAVKTGGNTPTYTTCLTDVASPPTGCTTTAYSTSSGIYFENITDGTHDFRIKSGSSAIDTGTTDATNAANDISNLARPSGAGYDIGAWEFSAAAGAALWAQSCL